MSAMKRAYYRRLVSIIASGGTLTAQRLQLPPFSLWLVCGGGGSGEGRGR